MTLLFFLIGIVALVAGSEFLIRGASRIAARLGISPLVIGLTVVAYGTSSTELAVSVVSCIDSRDDIAIGTILGSNIFNPLFILGSCALITPLVVSQKLIRLDVPILIAVSGLVWGMALDGRVDAIDSGLLLVAGVAYTVFVISKSREEERSIQVEYQAEFGEPEVSRKSSTLISLLMMTLGTFLLTVGSRLFVVASHDFATYLEISELIVGLTLSAAATSLPEMTTSIVASIRGERDIAVGTVIGSSLVNLLGVLGITGLAIPHGVVVSQETLGFDFPIMVSVAIACLPVFFNGKIARWHGALFLTYYAAYTAYLILSASNVTTVGRVGTAILWLLMPMTLVFLAIQAFVDHRRSRTKTAGLVVSKFERSSPTGFPQADRL